MRPADRQLTIVTGGSRGIGAATVLQLATEGHDVALAATYATGTIIRVAGGR